jgi:N-acetylmuramoyl-L-alanine amidase CwlA
MLPIKQRLDNDDHYDGGNTKEYIVMHDTGNTTDSDEGNANYFCTGSRDASAHYFVDDDSITQVVLDDDCSWHCGDGGGAYGITNRNSIGIEMCRVNNSVTATTEVNAIELVKYLMAKYNIPVERVVRHYDASRKICPASFSANGWSRWYAFKAKLTQPSQSVPTSGTLYRVRKTWEDIRSQIGAYSVFDNAKELADKNVGYKVFNENGQVVYPVQSTPIPTPQPQPSVDNEVLSLQRVLNRLGFRDANGARLVEDGISGTNTINATKNFQRVMGLADDGIAGGNTWGAINAIIAKPLCGIAYVQRYATRYIQWRIGSGVDGVFGSGTEADVKSWQSKVGLGADGVVGNQSWSALIG